uniref:ATP-dependent helicase C-terminal domain-containing protein n=1 Tax=Glossina palpalis gambiensis TaxID=67801 RepID=A0A1B0B836_9MUSC
MYPLNHNLVLYIDIVKSVAIEVVLLFIVINITRDETLSDISAILENLCNVVKAGLVCFLTSYDYLHTIYRHLQTCCALERISRRKRVFKDSRSGKLSEGLNFTDDLRRGVIVVGLPYPNQQEPEMQERPKYLDSTLGSGSGEEC